MESKAFDKKIDDLDLSTLRCPNQKQKRVNVDFPVWIIDYLDKGNCSDVLHGVQLNSYR